MDLSILLNGQPKTASIVFAHKVDFPAFAKTWEDSIGDDRHPYRRDAVEFAYLAQMRCSTHQPLQPYAAAIDEFKVHIKDNPYNEVACFVCLKCDWFKDSEIIGFCHFRRTWSNNIVLDYLGAHPFIAAMPTGYHSVVNGVGSALVYFIIQAAKVCGSDLIWGEATQNSWEFYQGALKLDSVKDLILIPKDKFTAFSARMEASWAKGRSGATAPALVEIYKIEAQNPPFVGTRNPVMVPPASSSSISSSFPYMQRCRSRRILASGRMGTKPPPIWNCFAACFLVPPKAVRPLASGVRLNQRRRAGSPTKIRSLLNSRHHAHKLCRLVSDCRS